MDCKTARAVWSHPDGFIAGVRQHLPGAIERLEEQVRAFSAGTTNPFQQSVARLSGVETGYYVHHAEDGDPIAKRIHDVVGDAAGRVMLQRHFSKLVGRPIRFGNACCSACITDAGTLSDDQLIALQRAAIQVEPDGSTLHG